MSTIITIYVKMRRFDLTDKPTWESKQFQINQEIDYRTLKEQIWKLLDVTGEDKVIKIRNKELVLIPLTTILEATTPENYLLVDISNIQQSNKSTANLQDAYLDAVRQKLQNLEHRIIQAEQLIPQIQMRRQAHMEQTVFNLSNRVSFLNRRVDELLPPQWKSKMPITIA